MDLLPTADHEAVADAVAGVLAAAGYPGALRALPPGTGLDPDLWATGAELGWLGLGLPEGAGGVGLGPTHEVMVFRELGRRVAPGPFLPTVLAAHLAVDAGAGAVVAQLLAGGAHAAWAEPLGDGLQLTGAADPTWAVRVEGARLELVAAGDLGDLEVVDGIDPSVVVLRSGRGAAAAHASDRPATVARGALLAAAALVGLAEAARDLAAAHAGARQQFGRPIGSFQAVKHRCADMAIRAEAAWAQVAYAAARLELGDDSPRPAASAKVVALDAARRNAAGAVQVHGALGFTQEADPQLFLRRSHVWEREGGDRRHHLASVLAG